jgi:hypothetical protein
LWRLDWLLGFLPCWTVLIEGRSLNRVRNMGSLLLTKHGREGWRKYSREFLEDWVDRVDANWLSWMV